LAREETKLLLTSFGRFEFQPEEEKKPFLGLAIPPKVGLQEKLKHLLAFIKKTFKRLTKFV